MPVGVGYHFNYKCSNSPRIKISCRYLTDGSELAKSEWLGWGILAFPANIIKLRNFGYILGTWNLWINRKAKQLKYRTSRVEDRRGGLRFWRQIESNPEFLMYMGYLLWGWMDGVFIWRGQHDFRFVRGITHYLRFGKSIASQVQYDIPGNPLMCLLIYDPWFSAVVFRLRPIAV